MFLGDHPTLDSAKVQILPNYPPQIWHATDNRAWLLEPASPLRLIYVGSLSRRDTFIAEVIDWVVENENAELDIYCYNLDGDTREFLGSIDDARVRFHAQGVDYDELPQLLSDYHVGLILYRANTPNYEFNASNKLFEYLAVGLDVWYPVQMKGVHPYATSTLRPRVFQVDFDDLENTLPERLDARASLPQNDPPTTAEEVYSVLRSHIKA